MFQHKRIGAKSKATPEQTNRRARIEEMKLEAIERDAHIKAMQKTRSETEAKAQAAALQAKQQKQSSPSASREMLQDMISLNEMQKEHREQRERRKKEIDAAVRIQSIYRAKQSRDRVNHMMKEKHSAVLIQSLIRGKKARNRVHHIRQTLSGNNQTTMNLMEGSFGWISSPPQSDGDDGDNEDEDDDNDNQKNRRSMKHLRRYHYQNIGLHDKYTVHACGIHVNCCLRRNVIRIVESIRFVQIINCIILLDCVVQALSWQSERDNALQNKISHALNQGLEWYYLKQFLPLFIYTCEMFLKMLAFGISFNFTHNKTSYFHSSWNVLDFSIGKNEKSNEKNGDFLQFLFGCIFRTGVACLFFLWIRSRLSFIFLVLFLLSSLKYL
jgi:Skp family chaperone for outer membrane proteins